MKKFLLILALVNICVNAQTINKNYFSKNYIKQVMKSVAYWQLENPKHDLWDWTNGALYVGISAAYKSTKDQKLLDAMLEMGERNNWNPGPRFQHADDHVIAQTYIDLYRIKKNKNMIQPFIEQMNKFISAPYSPNGIEKITWWWCDALFMAPPALIKLSKVTRDEKYMLKSDSLYHECYNLLYDKEEHLFARDLGYVIKGDVNDKREANGKKIFWSRGNGWVLAGIVSILNELPQKYKGRSFYKNLFKEMAEKIVTLQQQDGLWRSSLLDPDSYPGGEASGSGFYTFALAWGINNGLLNKREYLPIIKKAWIGLNSLIQPAGYVGWCQPIGADPRKNFSAESWEVYGTGAYLLAGSEVMKLKK